MQRTPHATARSSLRRGASAIEGVSVIAESTALVECCEIKHNDEEGSDEKRLEDGWDKQVDNTVS